MFLCAARRGWGGGGRSGNCALLAVGEGGGSKVGVEMFFGEVVPKGETTRYVREVGKAIDLDSGAAKA